jgi:1,2-diacylglycerol 3-alpha-glucosyltransferase
MHIGFFTDSYVPRRSGVVRAIETVAPLLRQRGHRVLIFAPAYPGYTDTDPDVHRFPSVAAPGYGDFPLAVPYAPSHLRAIKQLGLDLVHSHSPFLLGGLGVWVARSLRLPIVFTYHTLYGEYAHYAPLLGDLTRPFITAYTTAYCNRCDRVLVSVPSLVTVLRSYGVRARIEIVPSVGVDLAEGSRPAGAAAVRGWFRIPEAAPLLVFVGRLAREKAVSLLLDAVAGLPPQVWLLLVGDGPERHDLEARAARLGMAARTVFAGEQDHAHVLDALAAADVFVFPSQTETLGVAVLEAMAAARPVVAADGGAVREVVRDGETGRVTPPEPAAFRAAVAALLADPDLRRTMGARAREAAEAYSLDRVVERLSAVYLDVAAGRGAAAQTTA